MEVRIVLIGVDGWGKEKKMMMMMMMMMMRHNPLLLGRCSYIHVFLVWQSFLFLVRFDGWSSHGRSTRRAATRG
ncbi:hypothetical protein HBI56_194160 [Parastagonospora nodorum]|nr:hypothetical protein HBH56_205810 [Parastagonospora nodorum]KAH3923710.1 hypothetical protein HBH54_204680 [Parastagonospora nodorum]KAH3993000.1 hypothetical protein HBI10_207550 [Parastagonospora nodorum]KAH4059850.1 hypothetical protein HBH49_024970 [Parastagonospora nodorum]KAH4062129.1 hypothetical protein HBH50_209990 [Parastagonospora nodorum]